MALIRLPWQDGKGVEPLPRHLPGEPIHQITVVVPIAPGKRNDLADACAAVDATTTTEGASPFDRLAQVHMIRIEILDTLPVGARRPRSVALDVPMVIFGASFEGNIGHLARSMITTAPTQCDAVFGCCVDYPGLDPLGLAAWFRRFEVAPNLAFSAGFWSRSDIEQALDHSDRLRRFMPQAAALSAADLRAAFLKEFAGDIAGGIAGSAS